LERELLRVEDLSVYYGEVRALEGISLRVFENSAMVVFGSNGSGKSSLLKAIMGLVPYQGKVFFKGKNIDSLETHKRVALGISLATDLKNLFPYMSVEENLLLGAYRRGGRERFEKVYEYFPELFEVRKRRVGELSGGYQRMVSIGRALMSSPELLMIDELSLGLAPKVVERLAQVLLEIRKKEEVSLLLVEQEIYDVSSVVCSHGYVLDLGRLVAQGKVKELLEKDVVRRVYLGIA
jgi:branched-chain amino acid transport system ATP-binding protein